MISTKMGSLFIAYEGPNNSRQTAPKEVACYHFLFSILLFAAQSNTFLQLFWIFQPVNCPQLYFLSEPCNFFVKNSTIPLFRCTKTSFPSPHRKQPKLCKNGRSSVRDTDCSHLVLHLPNKKLVPSSPSSHVFIYTNASTESCFVFVFHTLCLSLSPSIQLMEQRAAEISGCL